MRYQVGHAEVLVEGAGEAVEVGVLNSAKAIKGLIDGAYSRKVEAITRELATNAFDGHKMVNSIAPFEVHLPTALNPVFWIRDFGPGMSRSFMASRYAMLFDSTKDGLNPEDGGVNPDDQVGCLGIGRLSFFAYTDACTVTNWQDGLMRVYSVFMGASGRPQVTPMGELSSDEPDGVKVEFAVRTKDFNEFKTAATRVFKGFPIQPTGLPEDVQKAIAVEAVQIGDGWKAFPKDYLPGGGFYARQGCVLYPIDLEQIDARAVEDADGKVHLSSDFSRFTKTDLTVVIDFKIGSLGFDLSRERLSYDDATVRALRSRWESFTGDVERTFTQMFKAEKSPFERMKLAYSTTVQSFGALFELSRHSGDAAILAANLQRQFPTTSGGYHAGFPFALALMKPDANCGKFGYSDVKAFRNRSGYGNPLREERYYRNSAIIYIDRKHPKNRTRLSQADIKKAVGKYLLDTDTPMAFLIRKDCLTVSNWRRWGCPKIVRLSDLQPDAVPKKPRADRTGVHYGFDRFKIPAPVTDGYMPSPADFEVKPTHRFALINCGLAVCEADKPFMTIGCLLLFGRLMAMHTRQRLILINTRKNEAANKWDGFKRVQPMFDTLVAGMSSDAIRKAVNALNYYRFHGSRYDEVRRLWKAANPDSHDPINRLARFEKRYGKLNAREKDIYLDLPINGGMSLIVDQIIERGRAMGLEVLPELSHNDYSDDKIRYANLLPARWEKIVDTVSAVRLHRLSSQLPTFTKQFYQLLLKDALSTC